MRGRIWKYQKNDDDDGDDDDGNDDDGDDDDNDEDYDVGDDSWPTFWDARMKWMICVSQFAITWKMNCFLISWRMRAVWMRPAIWAVVQKKTF